MPYQTDEKLKSYLDTNQLHREQMCRSVLEMDKRFTDVRPRHPGGGPDGGRDIQAVFREEQTAYGAVGFINQANDSDEQKKQIKKKYTDDLNNALSSEPALKVFVFFTNINLTIGEKDILIDASKKRGIDYCDIFDRERIRISLDSPDGFSVRFQYLNIPLTEAEQASFFARWGDDIQSIIASGFQKIDNKLNRILFLQESGDPISSLTLWIELDRKYNAEEIGHFRCFCNLTLKEPKHSIFSILFGSSDKSNRMRSEFGEEWQSQRSGIKYGIGSGQWEQNIDLDGNDGNPLDDEKWNQIGSGSSIGRSEVEFISINYSKDSLIRFFPVISLNDLNDAMYLLVVNKLLAKKIKAIHVIANGYKLQEIKSDDIQLDESPFEFKFPVIFNETELSDPWVRIRSMHGSTYQLRFFENTPKRLFSPNQVEDSLERRKKNA